jgi:tetratricopeptide (TPR) repeat protein
VSRPQPDKPSISNAMKRLLIPAVGIFILAGQADAQSGSSASPSPRIETIMIPKKEGNPIRIFIDLVGEKEIRYFENANTTATSTIPIADAKQFFFPEPQAFSTAMGQFRARDYKAALAGFSKVAEEFKGVRRLPNNPSTRAQYFEIECLRLLGDYNKMSGMLGAFNKSGLTRENELRQLELNLMWDAVGRKAWEQLAHLVDQRSDARMPGNQIAQVAYCRGLVLEQKGEIDEALSAYNEAIVADAAASEVVARMAAINILTLIDSDPLVKTAREAWGTEDEMKNSPGHSKLLEAGAVARLFEDFVGAGAPLPDKFRDYVKYEAKESDKQQ